jgi:hypothetical protein
VLRRVQAAGFAMCSPEGRAWRPDAGGVLPASCRFFCQPGFESELKKSGSVCLQGIHGTMNYLHGKTKQSLDDQERPKISPRYFADALSSFCFSGLRITVHDWP